MSTLTKIISTIIVATQALGCFSYFTGDASEGAKLTISELSSSYITYLISANFDAIGNNIFTSVYLATQKLSEEEYTVRVTSLKSKWPVENHPLAHLTITDSSINGNSGTVTLQRLDKTKSFPKVTIKYEWTGNSWSVIDDNILGSKDLYETYK